MKKLTFNSCHDGYESGLFYMNKRDIPCADPGALYVSVEDDPKHGGYFYTYFTGEAAVNQQDHKLAAFRCYRSRDLESFERVGAVADGFSLRIDDNDWARKFFWAPEVILDKKSKKYYMYFSASTGSDGNADKYYCPTDEDRWAGLHLGIAVSDTPMGPFVMVDSSDYPGGKNLNGDIITATEPPVNFAHKLNIGHCWSAIDVSPFFAPDGASISSPARYLSRLASSPESSTRALKYSPYAENS